MVLFLGWGRIFLNVLSISASVVRQMFFNILGVHLLSSFWQTDRLHKYVLLVRRSSGRQERDIVINKKDVKTKLYEHDTDEP